MRSPAIHIALAALLTVGVSVLACTDAPSAPEAEAGAGAAQLAIAPKLAVSGGPAATSHTQADALREAFELVDRFRLVVRRLDGEVVADEVVEVSGEPPYELSLSVPVQQLNEEFDVELTAQDGSVRLFRAGPFRVRSTPEGGPTQTTPVDADLEYVGPGATAASIELEPGVVALSPGGTATLEATVRGEGGNVERGVPLSWSSSDEGRLTVSGDGGVEGVADGTATVTVVSPNGVSATASVYVVAGQVAFVRGGGIHQASAGGGAERLVDGGSQPAWSGDGSTLFYVQGGTVRQMDGGPAGPGRWPAVSPDGTKLAVERDGTVYFVNLNGSNATQGPNGGQPVWAPGGSELLVSAGSIDRVHASGSSRTTVVDEAGAGMPAVATGGAVAYRGADGGIFVGTTRISPEGQSSSSRPALSANGRWVVFEAGGELQVAPADGGGAPVSFGVGSGSSPAWRGHGFTTDPPEVRVEGTSPESPKVGDEVTISGSGFDWIIPANNRVSFPGGESAVAGDTGRSPELIAGAITSVSSNSISAIVPSGVRSGAVVVETRTGQASTSFSPASSALAIRAETESGGPVAGVGVTATAGDGSTTSATTGEDGTATIEDLAGGSYTLEWSVPEGFSVEEAPSSVELPWSETVDVTATLAAEVVDFELVPAEPRVEVGESVELEVRALDVLGNEVTDGVESSWRVLISRVEIEGEGLSRTLTGVHPSSEPGDARFEVIVEGVEKRFGATVTSRIAGRVIDDGGTPLEGIEVGLSGDESASAATDAEGRYSFGGLFAGSYTVRATPPAEHEARPPSHDVQLWEANPTGTAGFRMVDPTGHLAAPEVLYPTGGILFNHYPRDTYLTWAPVDGADRYVVQREFFDPGQEKWVGREFRTDETTNTHFLHTHVGDQPGRWRVWAIDGNGAPGKMTEWHHFDYESAGPVVAGQFGTPTVDGSLASGEWSNAAVLTVMVPTLEGGVIGRILTMNDQQNFYMAFAIEEGMEGSEFIVIGPHFNNASGAQDLFDTVDGDDCLVVSSDVGTLSDNWIEVTEENGIHCQPDVFDGGTRDGEAAVELREGRTTFELSHPLDSPDDVHDFSLNPGDRIGFNVIYFHISPDQDSAISTRIPIRRKFTTLELWAPAF